MSTTLISTANAADCLGIAVRKLYEWPSQSDAGEFQIRGRNVTIDDYQGGRRGQGQIKFYIIMPTQLNEGQDV